MHLNAFYKVKQSEEYHSFIIRICVGLFASFFTGIGLYLDIFNFNFHYYLLIAGSFFVLALIIFLDIFRQLASSSRRYLTLFIDVSYTSITLLVTIGDTHIVWLFYIWLYIGYAARYGKSYLFAAQLLTLFQYNLILVYTNSWPDNYLDLSAQMLVLILLPIYLLSMIKRLQLAKQEAEEMAKIKTHFLTSMSHEIRTPLNGIIGSSHLLQKTELNAEQKKFCQALHYSSELLHTLIDNILDIEKIEANKLSIQQASFSLPQCINEVVHSVLYFATSKGLQLNTTIDPQLPDILVGDKQRISQVLLNLLSNAIKFTQHGHIDLSVQLKQQLENSYLVSFQVSDTGLGVAKENQANIFEAFSQFNPRQNEIILGSGLGMAISKELTELMNGDIQLISDLGKGSTFIMTLALNASAKENINESNLVAEPKSNSYMLKKYHILIAEDDDINAMILQQFLQDLGHSSERLLNGQQALEKLTNKTQAKAFDLVFMDLHMPQLSGVEVTEQLRKQQINIPIVGLTANATTEDKNHCLEVGMNAFLTKPVTPEQIKQVIQQIYP